VENQFTVLDSSDGIGKLLFDTSRADECINFARTNGLRRIMLNPYKGYQSLTLDPILPLAGFIEDLIIGDENLDLSAIGNFPGLKYLGVPDIKKSVLDLSCFQNLKTLAFTQSKKVHGFETCQNLESLSITNIKSLNLSALQAMPFLKELNLYNPAVESLEGIQKYSSLEKMEIYAAKKLRLIGAISGVQSSIVELKITKTSGIQDIQTLAELHSLKTLVLAESGSIQSLSFMNGFENIEIVSFWGTTILDGDMTLCAKAKKVSFDNKMHYNRKVEDFQK
jgi:hypothetical protein